MSLVIKLYFTSSMLNMFRALIHPSSGACDFSIESPHWSCVLGGGIRGVVSGLQPGHYSSLPAPNLQPTANQERNDQCGNKHYSGELLMMGIVVPETC